MKHQENWIQNEKKTEKQKNRISTCRSRAYYVSAGQKDLIFQPLQLGGPYVILYSLSWPYLELVYILDIIFILRLFSILKLSSLFRMDHKTECGTVKLPVR